MEIPKLYQIFQQYPLISTDSRKIEPGSIFFALKGDNFDGNQYAVTAIKSGAAYAVVDSPFLTGGSDDRIIFVGDVLKTLQDLARYHRLQLGIPILAITGTNGKTTTKELTAAVLSKKFSVIFTQGNLNNHIGVPLTLLSLQKETSFGVIEMGANHPGEIEKLCEIALPDFGLITNVGKAHLEGFGSFEGVIQAKTELYRFIKQKNGIIFVNSINPYLIKHLDNISSIYYSPGKGGEGLEGETIDSDPFLKTKILFPKGWLYVKTKLAGSYNLENIMAAAAIGIYFGIDPKMIVEALEQYTPQNNRSQFSQTPFNNLLMDAYNANPSSMRAALENFNSLRIAKKRIILGDMLELGNSSPEEHQQIADLLSQFNFEKIYLVGPLFFQCKTSANCLHFSDNSKLIDEFRQEKPTGFTFLIKGSRGMKLEQLVQYL